MSDTVKEKKHLSDIIGEHYKEWKSRDVIMIKAPTGCGKTYFCLNTYLKYIKEKNDQAQENNPNPHITRILYLVNRAILKEQLIESVNYISNRMPLNTNSGFLLKSYIHIDTYQNIEQQLSMGYDLSAFVSQYDIAIYDEAHYFLADSNFNSYTKLSYDFLRLSFQDKIQIFMSATMDNIIPLITNYEPARNPSIKPLSSHYISICDVPKCYSYVDLKWFHTGDDITDLIKDNTKYKYEKWLIFVDNKQYGKSLYNSLIDNTQDNGISPSDIVYIDAEYRKNDFSNNAVSELSRYNSINKKIIITTSVMDNGVSFHDTSLRNIIIFADTEEEFIQMLGRKRQDNQKITVYVCLHTSKHFQDRLRNVQTKISAYNKCCESIYSMYPAQFITPEAQPYGLVYHHNTLLNVIELYNFKIKSLSEINKSIVNTLPVTENFSSSDSVLSNNTDNTAIINPIDFNNAMKYMDYVNFMDYMLHIQQPFLKLLLQDDLFHDSCKSFIYFYMGIVAINQFSADRLFLLEDFYQNMQKQLKTDQFAFAKQVCKWLDLPEQKTINVENINTERRDKLIKIIDEYIDKDLDSKQNQSLKEKIRNYIRPYLIPENGFEENVKNDITKTKRNITPEKFNNVCNAIHLPYIMEKPKSSIFRIKKI